MTVEETKLPAGKLPTRLLKRLLKRYAPGDKRVVVGPGIGMDSAVIDFYGRYLLAKTDPITFVASDIGVYALHINANDIAVMGGVPRWFLATVLLPEGTATAASARKIFSQLSRACESLKVTLCGGHTEITGGIKRPIVVGQMLGEVKKDRLVTAAGARINDDIILTKGLAIEGTSIIARTLGEELVKKGEFSMRFIARCRGFLKSPGLSVIEDARAAMRQGRVHAMHDPTEGGLSAGLHELAIASGLGVLVTREAITVLPQTRRLAAYFGIDPMGLIASGALIASVDPASTRRVLRGLERAGIEASRIGAVTKKGAGVKIAEGGKKSPLKLPERDEITKII